MREDNMRVVFAIALLLLPSVATAQFMPMQPMPMQPPPVPYGAPQMPYSQQPHFQQPQPAAADDAACSTDPTAAELHNDNPTISRHLKHDLLLRKHGVNIIDPK
jgi:hypothetical protein